MKYYLFISLVFSCTGCFMTKGGSKQNIFKSNEGNWMIEYQIYNNLHYINFSTLEKDTVGYFVAGTNEFPLSHDKYFSPGTTLRINKVVYQIAYRNNIDSVYLWRDRIVFKDRPVIEMPLNCKQVLKHVDSLCILKTPHYTSQIEYFNYLYPVLIRD